MPFNSHLSTTTSRSLSGTTPEVSARSGDPQPARRGNQKASLPQPREHEARPRSTASRNMQMQTYFHPTDRAGAPDRSGPHPPTPALVEASTHRRSASEGPPDATPRQSNTVEDAAANNTAAVTPSDEQRVPPTLTGVPDRPSDRIRVRDAHQESAPPTPMPERAQSERSQTTLHPDSYSFSAGEPRNLDKYWRCFDEACQRADSRLDSSVLSPSMLDKPLPVTTITAILYRVRLPGPGVGIAAWADAIKVGWTAIFPGVSCTSVSWFTSRGAQTAPSFRLELSVPLEGPCRPESVFLTPLLLKYEDAPVISLGTTSPDGQLQAHCIYARPDTRLSTIFSLTTLPGDMCRRAWYNFRGASDPEPTSNDVLSTVLPYLTRDLPCVQWADPSSRSHPRYLVLMQDEDAMHTVHKRFFCCFSPFLPHLSAEDGDHQLSRLAVNATRVSTDVAARSSFLAFEGFTRVKPRQTPVFTAISDASTPFNTVVSLLEAIEKVGMLGEGAFGLSHFSVHHYRNAAFVDFRLNPITSTGSSHESAVVLASTMARLIVHKSPAPLILLDPAIQWHGDRLRHGTAALPFRNRCPLCKMSMKQVPAGAYASHVSSCTAPQGTMASCHRCQEEDHTIVHCPHVPRDPKLIVRFIEALPRPCTPPSQPDGPACYDDQQGRHTRGATQGGTQHRDDHGATPTRGRPQGQADVPQAESPCTTAEHPWVEPTLSRDATMSLPHTDGSRAVELHGESSPPFISSPAKRSRQILPPDAFNTHSNYSVPTPANHSQDAPLPVAPRALALSHPRLLPQQSPGPPDPPVSHE